MNKSIKITSGEFRGRSIKSPDSTATHPMGAREKLALFNMISDYIPGASVLDAFAGSGALGIEALSRGAAFVVFIEKDARACKTINENLRKLNISSSRGSVLQYDIYKILKSVTDCWNLVLADPPYDEYDEKKIQVLARVVAEPGGVLILSHPDVPPRMPGLELLKTRRYAQAHISIYVRKTEV